MNLFDSSKTNIECGLWFNWNKFDWMTIKSRKEKKRKKTPKRLYPLFSLYWNFACAREALAQSMSVCVCARISECMCMCMRVHRYLWARQCRIVVTVSYQPTFYVYALVDVQKRCPVSLLLFSLLCVYVCVNQLIVNFVSMSCLNRPSLKTFSL